MTKFFLLLFLFVPSELLAEYKNTSGKALEKSFSDMVKWIRSDQKPALSSIEISSE